MVEAVKVLESTTFTPAAVNSVNQERLDATLAVTPVFSGVLAKDLTSLYHSISKTTFRLSNHLPSITSFLSFNDSDFATMVHHLRDLEGLPM
ncbi:MAG: hypothetical protein ACI9UN_004573 [Granulosicoccus sp.]|jgi:hypothetical protein